MADWIDPIFDRTQADCDSKTAKGSLTASDLNRIESNMRYIYNAINERGYAGKLYDSGQYPWTRVKYLREASLNAIEQTIKELRESSFGSPDLPEIALTAGNAVLGYEQINVLEYYLYDMKWLLDQLDSVAPICGMSYCGE